MSQSSHIHNFKKGTVLSTYSGAGASGHGPPDIFYSISAIPLGTCEKAKACEYRES